jgi:hypothetical protein
MIFEFVRITTTSLTSGNTDHMYSQSVGTVNSQGTVTLALQSGSLASGLSVGASSITGTPTSAGSSSFTIRATDTVSDIGTFIDDQSYVFTVNQPGGGLPPEAWNRPKNINVSLDRGTLTTNDPVVKLRIAGTLQDGYSGIPMMVVDDNPDFIHVGQEPYAPVKEFNICRYKNPCLVGTHTVYLKLYTAWGIASPVIPVLIEYRLATQPSAAVSPSGFLRILKYGMRGEDVRQLQRVLNNQGFTVTEPGQETTYFGPATRAALIKFQEAYADRILRPAGLEHGTGILGPYTRQVIQEFK